MLSLAGLSFFFLMLFWVMVGSINHDEQNSGCVFMIAGHAVCLEGVLGHLEAWKQIIAASMPSLSILFFLIIFFVSSVYRNHLYGENQEDGLWAAQRWREKNYSFFIISFYRLLFADGILHPKIFDPIHSF